VIATVLAFGLGIPGAHAAANGFTATGHSYLDGLIAGEAQGREEGRALQLGQSLPAGDRDAAETAFKAGYAAGANDAFSGYDGGWMLGVPYVIVLAPGTGPITYRIGSRTPLEPGVAYFLCPDGHGLCQAPRK
jgi:hypothetical protein